MSRRTVLKSASLIAIAAAMSPRPAVAAKAGDERLLGTWRSNRELTARFWRFPPDSTPEAKATIAEAFGQLKWKFTKDMFYYEFGDVRFSKKYRVIAKDALATVVALGPATTPAEEFMYMRFEGDAMYAPTGNFNVEFFTRVPA
ncbi:MAG: hypothetical protein JSR18_04340 [Proteobacteria bacterium]|nr:hypothetical protein [Pseudomonadota bacterium]